MHKAQDKIDDALKDLDAARVEISRFMCGLKHMIKDLPCNAFELLQLLDELADAEVDVRGHHRDRYKEECARNSHELQSQECKDDWTRCFNRREKAINTIVRFAIALKKGEAEAA